MIRILLNWYVINCRNSIYLIALVGALSPGDWARGIWPSSQSNMPIKGNVCEDKLLTFGNSKHISQTPVISRKLALQDKKCGFSYTLRNKRHDLISHSHTDQFCMFSTHCRHALFCSGSIVPTTLHCTPTALRAGHYIMRVLQLSYFLWHDIPSYISEPLEAEKMD